VEKEIEFTNTNHVPKLQKTSERQETIQGKANAWIQILLEMPNSHSVAKLG